MAITYYYARQGQRFGPVSTAELRTLLHSGQIAPTDLVWTEGMPTWKSADEVSGLLPPVFSAAANGANQSSAVSRSVSTAAGQQPERSTVAAIVPSLPVVGSPSTLSQTVAEHFKQIMASAGRTASVTGRHMSRLAASGIARGRIRLAHRDVLRSQAALGQQMHSAGLGEEKMRRLIAELADRIESLKAARCSSRPVETELSATYAALAVSVLGSDQSPKGLEAEFDVARAAQNRMHSAQNAAEVARREMQLMQTQQPLQIGIGYLGILLCVLTIAWASWGSGTAQQASAGAAHDGSGSSDLVGDSWNSEGATESVPGSETPPGSVAEQSICNNCNGSGQSNCVQCFGTGKRSCFNCNGSGRTVNNLQCFQCNGTGKQSCSFCQNGRVQCPQCFGSGRR